ncbi:hypothetical protein A3741_26650 [Oleiphilus sp. HI0069]|nr:hypothetical protein A3741_26650 [Oleiphilus sp. HI0069]
MIMGVCILCCTGLNAELRVMTLNTEWLWTPYDGKADGSKVTIRDMSKKDYLTELAFYAKLVREHRIDILAVSEIENKYVAIDLANRFGKDWKAYFTQGRDTATGQDVALISRLEPVKGSLTNYGFPCGKTNGVKKKKCLSKVVGARFYLDNASGEQVAVISSHFLSKRNDSKSKRLKRESQALALSKAVEREANDFSSTKVAKVIALGDFNDTANSTVLKLLRAKGSLLSASSCRMQDSIESHSKPKHRKKSLVDHILYRGLTCLDDYAVSTGSYSDHPAIVAILR